MKKYPGLGCQQNNTGSHIIIGITFEFMRAGIKVIK